jgi:ribonuclease T2
MNQKLIVRLVLGVLVAVIGAWQLKDNSGQGGAPAKSGQHRGTQQGERGERGMAPPGGGGSSDSGATSRSNQVGDFDYYLVSLSWSPAYCVSHPQDQRQCGGRGFGFVLHGLWPQKSAGGYPEECVGKAGPSATAVQRALAFMPSEKLIKHEWQKHGTCSGLSGDEYLALADRAFGSIQIPAGFQAPDRVRDLSADQIVAEFVAANPGLPKDSLSLRCSGKELEEVRVCVSTELKPSTCGKGVRSQCGRDLIQVRSVR